MKKVPFFFLCMLSVLFSSNLIGQNPVSDNTGEWNGKITGKVLDNSSNTPLEYATITLFREKDSIIITGTTSGSDGLFTLASEPGRFYIKVEYISYRQKIISGIELTKSNQEANIGNIPLKPSEQSISTTNVSAQKSQVQMSLDKKVFNVSSDIISTGGDAASILDRVPSVQVDIDGNVLLRGSSNVKILIDGKPSTLIGGTVADALEQIPANMIERVEVITNPSARYEATGMSGIINIVLKKERKKGLNGIATFNTAYPSNHNGTISLNYGAKKINYFMNGGINYRSRPGNSVTDRETQTDSGLVYQYNHGNFNRSGWQQNIRGGLEYNFNDDTKLTGTASTRLQQNDNLRTNNYSLYYGPSTFLEKSFRESKTKGNEYIVDYNLNFRKTYDNTTGHELTADFTYSDGNENEHSNITETFYTDEDTKSIDAPVRQDVSNIELQNRIILKVDYVRPTNETDKFEAGFLINRNTVNLDYDISNWIDSLEEFQKIVNLSNVFLYRETVAGAYMTYGGQYKKFSYMLGVRPEYSLIEPDLLESTDDAFTKSYLNLFPSLHLNRKFMEGLEGQISYSRRIERPRSRWLNPFVSFSDPRNLWMGNPNLKPEFTNSYELGVIKYWKVSTLNSSIYYRNTNGVIQRIRSVDSSGISRTTPQNLTQSDNYGFELTYGTSVKKWLKLNGSINYFRNIIDGSNLGSEYKSDFYSWTSRLNSTFIPFKDFNIQLTMNYRGPQQTTQGTSNAVFYSDIGFQTDIWQKKAAITLKVSDILNSRKWRSDTYGENFYIHSQYQHMTRQIMFTFSYKINNYKQKEDNEGKKGGFEMEDGGY